MTEPTVNLDARFDLLKKIESKLTWIAIFLFIIMLNTCSVSDDVEDAIRESRRADRAAPEAVAPATKEPA